MAKQVCEICGGEFNPGGPMAAHLRKCSREAGLPIPERKDKSGDVIQRKRKPNTGWRLPMSGDWLLWDAGTWRGWAVAAVRQGPAEFSRLRTAHLGEVLAAQDALLEDVRDGRVFFVNPDQVVRLIEQQLSDIDDESLNEEQVTLWVVALNALNEAHLAVRDLRMAVEPGILKERERLINDAYASIEGNEDANT